MAKAYAVKSNPGLEKKYKAYMACKEAGVSIPEELENLFTYAEYSMPKSAYEVPIPFTEYHGYHDFVKFTVRLENIPEGCSEVAFYVEKRYVE